jgi:hypothetical protein
MLGLPQPSQIVKATKKLVPLPSWVSIARRLFLSLQHNNLDFESIASRGAMDEFPIK